MGLAVVLAASLFFLVFDKSTEELEGALNATAPTATQQPLASAGGELAQARQDQLATPAPTPTPPSDSPATESSATPEAAAASPSAAATPDPPAPAQPAMVQLPPNVISGARFYPGEALKAVYWSNPLAFEPTPPIEEFIRPYRPVPPEAIAGLGELPVPTRLIIPSIDVESRIEELQILSLGNSQAYETPKNVVGHIPETANPGEGGSTWLFGHLESPIRNEGNVFAQLPKIPSLLRRGEEVFVVVENGTQSYLYRIVESKVVPQEELVLSDHGSSELVLVTCVPRFIYDHRLIIRAELVGVKG